MSQNVQKERKGSSDTVPRSTSEGLELMTQIPGMYKKMTEAWLNYTKISATKETKPEDLSSAWAEAFSGNCKEAWQMMQRSCTLFGLPVPGEKSQPVDILGTWQSLLGYSRTGIPAAESMKAFTDHATEMSEKMKDGYANLAKSQFDFIQNIFKAGRTEKADPFLNLYTESSKMLFDAWFTFCADCTNARLQIWKSFIPKEK